MIEADGIILGSPVYFSMMTPELKALIDRAGYVARANEDMFKRKVGAAVVAVRRAGAILTFDAINNFLPHEPNNCSRCLILEHWDRQKQR